MSQAWYLVDEKEAELLAGILCAIGKCENDEWYVADRIICATIEMGLTDADAGPAVFTVWRHYTGDEDAMHDVLVKAYTACGWCEKRGHAQEECPEYLKDTADDDEEDE